MIERFSRANGNIRKFKWLLGLVLFSAWHTIAFCALISIAVAIAPSVYAVDTPSSAPDFLFSEDNQIVNTSEQFNKSMNSKTLVRDDKWLNAPLTRLDYVLIKIQSNLSDNLPGLTQAIIPEYFERAIISGQIEPPSAEFSAGYSDEKGRLIIGANVDILGKPKKPMKDFCERLLREIEVRYPRPPVGYSWQNGALGLLIRDDGDKYKDVVKILAESAVVSVHLSGGYIANGTNEFFMVGCMRQEAGGPVTFYKYSAVLP